MKTGKIWIHTAMAALAIFALTGCGKKQEEAVPTSVFQISDTLPTPERRLDRIQYLMNPKCELKPSDVDFILIEMAPPENYRLIEAQRIVAAMHLDRAGLATAQGKMRAIAKPEYQPAFADVDWWPTPQEFDGLKFYSTAEILKWPDGFAACHPDGDRLYIFWSRTP